jgi:hypothetical protein
LLRTGLARKYPVFFIYFALRTPYVLVPVLMDFKSNAYLRLWLVAEPVFCLLYILIAFELYRLVFANYKGLHTVGRWAMYFISTIAVGLSALSLIPKLGSLSWTTARFRFVLALERGVNTSLVIFLVLMLLFLSRYPIQLSRNVRVYAFVFPVFFLSTTLGILLFTLMGIQVVSAINSAMSALSLGCTVAFLFLLNPAGEAVRKVQAGITPEHAQVLLSRLDSLNTTLLRVSRR